MLVHVLDHFGVWQLLVHILQQLPGLRSRQLPAFRFSQKENQSWDCMPAPRNCTEHSPHVFKHLGLFLGSLAWHVPKVFRYLRDRFLEVCAVCCVSGHVQLQQFLLLLEPSARSERTVVIICYDHKPKDGMPDATFLCPLGSILHIVP
jgi:hypothetical protein